MNRIVVALVLTALAGGCASRPEALYLDRIALTVNDAVLDVGHMTKTTRPWLSKAVDALEARGFRAEWKGDHAAICRREDRGVQWEAALSLEPTRGPRQKATATCQLQYWHSWPVLPSKPPPRYPPASELIALSEEYRRAFVDACGPDAWNRADW